MLTELHILPSVTSGPVGRIHEPLHEKTNTLVFRPGPTQTGLYKHRRWQLAGNLSFRKNMNCAKRVAKTKALIRFAVTFKLNEDSR